LSQKRLLLIGGGHAHMVTLSNLHVIVEKGHQVTVIQPSEYHYYSGMGTGMLGGTYQPEEIRFATRRMVEKQGGQFILGKAAVIDPDRQVVRLEVSGKEVRYDVLSCNAGSHVPLDLLNRQGPGIFTVKPIEGLLKARQKILSLSSERPINVAVAGGGPSSVEIAGNVHQLGDRQAGHRPKIRIFAGKSLMTSQPARVAALARKSLSKRGIEIREGTYISAVESGRISLDNGQTCQADVIFLALGVSPSPIFRRSGLSTGPDGGLLVNRYLQSADYPNIFGGGDCVHFEPEPLDKVGVHAVRENPVLYKNLVASLEGGKMRAFNPGGRYLLIYNLGSNTGIFKRWPIIFSGRLAFRIKDHIDRQFIKRFQNIGF